MPAKRGATNVEFRKGFIEKLPVESGTVDYVISNCVINLSTDKPAVFREIARVLKPGGRFAVSDIVLLKPLPEQLARDISAYVGCISGASMLTEYLSMALAAGLRDLAIPRIAHGGDLMKMLAPEDICRADRPVADRQCRSNRSRTLMNWFAKHRRHWLPSSCTDASKEANDTL